MREADVGSSIYIFFYEVIRTIKTSIMASLEIEEMKVAIS